MTTTTNVMNLDKGNILEDSPNRLSRPWTAAFWFLLVTYLDAMSLLCSVLAVIKQQSFIPVSCYKCNCFPMNQGFPIPL